VHKVENNSTPFLLQPNSKPITEAVDEKRYPKRRKKKSKSGCYKSGGSGRIRKNRMTIRESTGRMLMYSSEEG
jgi:hypothetical protein